MGGSGRAGSDTRTGRAEEPNSTLTAALDSALAAALALGLIAVLAPRVAGFTTDSESYLDVARSVLAGDGLVGRVVDFWRPRWPEPLGMWPPLYPLAVAGAAAAGLSLEAAARAVSMVSFVVFALAFLALARRALGRRGSLAVTVLALTSSGVALAAVMAWSEMLYLALATLALLGLSRGEGQGGTRSLVLSGLCAGFAGLARYLGAILVPLGILELATRRAGRKALVYWTGAAILPPLAWYAHNVLLFGSAAGPGLPASDRTPGALLGSLAGALRWQLLPEPLARNVLLAGALLVAMALLLVLALRRGGAGRISVFYALGHLAALAGLRALFTFNELGERYVSPALPFLWLGASAGAVALAGRVRGSRTILALAALGLVGFSLVDLAGVVGTHRVPPPEAAAREEDLRDIRQLLGPGSGGGPVLSDAGHLVRSATRRGAIEIPALGFRLREFTAADELRWEAAGVGWGLFRRIPRGGTAREGVFGAYLEARVGGVGPQAWVPTDSTARFILYRLPAPNLRGNGMLPRHS